MMEILDVGEKKLNSKVCVEGSIYNNIDDNYV